MVRLATLDFCIRIAAAVSVSTLGFAMLVLVSIMGTDSGTATALWASVAAFLVGCVLILAIVLLALFPGRVARWVPGPSWLGHALVRVPVYACGIGGSFLLVRQIWQVTIPELLK